MADCLEGLAKCPGGNAGDEDKINQHPHFSNRGFWINAQMKGDGREMHFFAPALPPPLSTFVA